MSIGYPGQVVGDRVVTESRTLSALMVRGHIVPMELGALSYPKGTIEQFTARFVSALNLDDVVIGGGNAGNPDELPPGCRSGGNAFAFAGEFRL